MRANVHRMITMQARPR